MARDLRGGPIKNVWLVAWAGDRLTLPWRARQEAAEGSRTAPQRLTLPVAAFLQRWRQHVPVPQTRVVRSYGLDHPTQVEALAVCRAALGPPPVAVPVLLHWRSACAQRGDAHPEPGPPAASSWWAPGSARVGVRLHRRWLGSVPPAVWTAGGSGPGRWWACGRWWHGGRGPVAVRWGSPEVGQPRGRPWWGPLASAPGRMPKGGRDVNSRA